MLFGEAISKLVQNGVINIKQLDDFIQEVHQENLDICSQFEFDQAFKEFLEIAKNPQDTLRRLR